MRTFLTNLKFNVWLVVRLLFLAVLTAVLLGMLWLAGLLYLSISWLKRGTKHSKAEIEALSLQAQGRLASLASAFTKPSSTPIPGDDENGVDSHA